MTSISNSAASNALRASRKSIDDGHLTAYGGDSVEAEIIEVVPELVFSEDSDGYSEFSDDQDGDNDIENPFNRHSDEDVPFDEYGNILFHYLVSFEVFS